MLVAFVAQATIVQTHVDYARSAASQAIAGQQVQLSKVGATGSADKSAVCPWCQQAAMAGHYFLPAANALPTAPPNYRWTGAVAIAAFGLALPAHGWLSRAPPR